MLLKRLKIALFAMLAYFAMGCSSEYHLRRAEWKNPDLFIQDTIVLNDTIIYNPPVVSDSVIITDMDTVIIEDTIVRLKFIRRVDTLWYEVDFKPDTATTTNEIVTDKIENPVIQKEVNANPWIFVAGVLVTMVLFIIGFNIARK